MLKLCSTFEDWLIDDGNYPPLKKDEKVNLSFYMVIEDIEKNENKNYEFIQNKYSEYNFCGKIIYNYSDIIIIDTKYFKFYVENRNKKINYEINDFVKGTGKVLVDYYNWVGDYAIKTENPPDIFYNFQIKKILEVDISEKYIQKGKNTIRFPTSLNSKNIIDENIKEIEKMSNDRGFIFYLLELEEIENEINRTYLRKK
jgi:hypothetical protein